MFVLLRNPQPLQGWGDRLVEVSSASISRRLLMPGLLFVTVAFGPQTASAHNDHRASASAAAQAEAFGQPGAAKDVTRTIAIHATDAMRFNPSALAIRQGETVRLRISNDGKIAHEFVLGTKDELTEHAAMMRQMPDMTHSDAHSVRIAPGQITDIVWKFSRAGKFLYACLIAGHWEAGMQGTVTVTAPVKR